MSKSLKRASTGLALLLAAGFAFGANAAFDGGAAEGSASPAEATASETSFGLGRPATEEEIAAWDVDVSPNGDGLPEGSGTVVEGEEIFNAQCAICHGDFGEGRDRWPALSGGEDTLTAMRPVKTIGSYWPYLSTVYDYVHRAMPFGNAQSLSDDEVYALTAYILFLNFIVEDEDFELSKANFTEIEMPNAGGFEPDDRVEEGHYRADADPCMSDCKPEPVVITMRARVLDVTPDSNSEESEVDSSVD
ncbi:diheme cytochrome c SoxD [Fulvimarina pelagi HTCC2506]|uniref:Diheme cytochrome c SoxD n=2 Tax=Fulvimarina pelagi TaxID=217511 RepID=Q0G1J3_9HYPH|nr:cytochrome c [Fulvimarina pelagi]EAU41088.1 diheme cytochrome c SoxD [Fulvimarina pelagi HTCC2506]BAT30898.1 diheme cytochrome c SoxD [Fulvimarina pelagi]